MQDLKTGTGSQTRRRVCCFFEQVWVSGRKGASGRPATKKGACGSLFNAVVSRLGLLLNHLIDSLPHLRADLVSLGDLIVLLDREVGTFDHLDQ